jgi:Holliday junction resolvase RusA-like endonuclease
VIELNVIGTPFPQGSKSAFIRGGKAIVTEGSSKPGRAGHAAWRQAVATATRDYLQEHPRPAIDEPIGVSMDFRFALTADKYRVRHRRKPDLSKLIRSTEDAMVDGGLLKDDSCIFRLEASKVYAHHEPPGCRVTVRLYGDIEADDREVLKAEAKQRRSGSRAV